METRKLVIGLAEIGGDIQTDMMRHLGSCSRFVKLCTIASDEIGIPIILNHILRQLYEIHAASVQLTDLNPDCIIHPKKLGPKRI